MNTSTCSIHQSQTRFGTGLPGSAIRALACGIALAGAVSGCGPGLDTAFMKRQMVYVANAASDSVAAYQLNQGEGRLNWVETEYLESGAAPRSLAIDRRNKLVFVAHSGSQAPGISVFTISENDGKLRRAGSLFATKGTPFTVGVHPELDVVYVSQTNDGGTAAVGAYTYSTTGTKLKQLGNLVTFPNTFGNVITQTIVHPGKKVLYLARNSGGSEVPIAVELDGTTGALGNYYSFSSGAMSLTDLDYAVHFGIAPSGTLYAARRKSGTSLVSSYYNLNNVGVPLSHGSWNNLPMDPSWISLSPHEDLIYTAGSGYFGYMSVNAGSISSYQTVTWSGLGSHLTTAVSQDGQFVFLGDCFNNAIRTYRWFRPPSGPATLNESYGNSSGEDTGCPHAMEAIELLTEQ